MARKRARVATKGYWEKGLKSSTLQRYAREEAWHGKTAEQPPPVRVTGRELVPTLREGSRPSD
ncbi:hypothetical protein GCM10007920_29660 [Ciceribacter naphthalenivorans]|uniref:Uncharacterized protein n=1 Tax=Sphingomonas psychrolutea TaxID=1259676 RepID=A0ABQ6EEV6_9SPHN|nr:hypothetical protein GCM10007920_29660 [Ciceribacter naphthalenivorans]GLT06034.1 hypothetical protein GCM10007926_29660 [Sphingomonas psychrolutea]